MTNSEKYTMELKLKYDDYLNKCEEFGIEPCHFNDYKVRYDRAIADYFLYAGGEK